MQQPDAVVGEITTKIVTTPQGGFPVDNIAYWKEIKGQTGLSTPAIYTVVHFKTGGFIDLNMTAVQFNSLVYGEPF
jgi:hypothetical protein